MEDEGEPLSLSQLIYSQSSQTQSSLPTFPATPKSKNIKKAVKSVKKEDDLIHDFYGLSEKKKAATNATPRKKRKRKERWSSIRKDEDAWVEQWETQSEAAARERLKQIQIKLEVQQRRWKKRRVDVRDEEDVGGVYENLVRKHGGKIHHKPTMLRMVPEDEKVSQSSFWEQGLSAPTDVHGIPKACELTIKKRNDLPPGETLDFDFPRQRSRVEELRQVFPLRQHTNPQPINGAHFHQGTLARLAAMHLITGPSKDEALDDDLMRFLFEIDHKGKSNVVLWEASELGMNAKVFIENAWTDRSEAARQLGLDGQSDKHTLHTTDHKALKQRGVDLRARVLAHTKKPAIISEQNDDDSEMDSISQFNGNENSSATSIKEEPSTEKGKAPVDYAYKQNSIPPVPSFPLDQVGVIFGSEDPHSQAIRSGRIQSSTADLTVCTLLARVTAAMQNEDHERSHEAHESIMEFLDVLIKENTVNLAGLRSRRGAINVDLHDVSEYNALMQYVRYVINRPCANVLNDKREESERHVKVENTGTSFDRAKHDSIAKDVNDYAEEVSLLLSRVEGSEGLKNFPRIHLIYALSLVARELPPAAAEVFSNNEVNPFHTVRKTLEFLETHDMLVERSSEFVQFKTIMHAHLEHIFHQAARVVGKRCGNKGIDYGAWLSALQMGSLMLCSGIKIGGGAFPYPSFRKTRVRLDSYFSQDAQNKHVPHEVRRRLKKFDESRLEVAEGIHKFLDDFDSAGARSSHMIVTALEWSQALALVLGPIRKDDISCDSRWENIRRLHARHLVLSLQIDAAQIEELKVRDGIYRDDILVKLASDLENTPSDIGNWRRLCRELGPVVSKSRKEGEALRQRGHRDHAKSQSAGWWGRERMSWWNKYLLVLRTGKPSKVSPETIFDIAEMIEKKLPKADNREVVQSMDVEAAPTKLTYGWLHRTIRSIHKKLDADQSNQELSEPDGLKKQKQNVVKEPAPEVRSISLDEYLPRPLPSPQLCERSASANPVSTGLENVSEDLEICCYKMFLLAHLYGSRDDSVRDGSWYLARMAAKNDQDETWDCILWLFSKGINIAGLVMDVYKSAVADAENSKKKLFSEDQRAAFRLGYACFGNRFSLIRENVPEFESWDSKKLKLLYKRLKRLGDFSEQDGS